RTISRHEKASLCTLRAPACKGRAGRCEILLGHLPHCALAPPRPHRSRPGAQAEMRDLRQAHRDRPPIRHRLLLARLPPARLSNAEGRRGSEADEGALRERLAAEDTSVDNPAAATFPSKKSAPAIAHC